MAFPNLYWIIPNFYTLESKSFNFFSVYLLDIDQTQLKNSNYDVLLSTWLVSMKIYPKWIFICIRNLPAQIKFHKENIRTMHETPEGYSESCQISKIETIAKTLNGFQLLTIVFITETILYSFQPLTIFAKSSILDVRLDFQYATG